MTGVVEVAWDESDIETVAAGETVTYDVTIYNRGNVNDTYMLSSTSTWGVTFSQNEVYLPWGANSSATVQVTIVTPADAKVTHPVISIRAVSANNTGASDVERLDVNIEAVYGLEASAGKAQTNGTVYTMPIVVRNTGNADDVYNLTISNAARDALADAGWSVSIPGSSTLSKQVSVLAGKNTTVNMELRRNSEPLDPNASLAISVASNNANNNPVIPVETVQLAPGDLDVSGQGANMDAPQVPGLTWVLMGLIALLAVAFVILRVNKGVLGRRRKR